ncbi:MAG: GTP-binding protein, partial [Ilumatobacteraceae bacterium]|nr:GTP-binding protein [Ilumatobacteraceae bacterium]
MDELLRQTGTFAAHQNLVERVMDSNDQERERGITILAKAASIEWR